MRWFKRKPKEAVDHYDRIMTATLDWIDQTREALPELRASGDVRLTISNYGHLVDYYSSIAIMHWRRGIDPRPAIRDTYKAYETLNSYRDENDPDRQFSMMNLDCITDWDMVYTLFWLNDLPVDMEFYHFAFMEERILTYNKYITHRIVECPTPEGLEAQAFNYLKNNKGLVDRSFRDLLTLLDEDPTDEDVDVIVKRSEENWKKRKTNQYYQVNSSIMGGDGNSNELALDFHLAAILKKIGWTGETIHKWHWDEQK